jgi:hypothetical protein
VSLKKRKKALPFSRRAPLPAENLMDDAAHTHPVAGPTARFYYICWKGFVNAKTGALQKYTEYFAAPRL